MSSRDGKTAEKRRGGGLFVTLLAITAVAVLAVWLNVPVLSTLIAGFFNLVVGVLAAVFSIGLTLIGTLIGFVATVLGLAITLIAAFGALFFFLVPALIFVALLIGAGFLLGRSLRKR